MARLEYNKQEEIQLRITEIESILENNLYEDKKEKQELIQEKNDLDKEYAEIKFE